MWELAFLLLWVGAVGGMAALLLWRAPEVREFQLDRIENGNWFERNINFAWFIRSDFYVWYLRGFGCLWLGFAILGAFLFLMMLAKAFWDTVGY